MATNPDNREAPRKRMGGAALLAAQAGMVNVRCQDISLTGMSVASPINLPVGCVCMIDVNLPSSGGSRHRTRMNVRVVNCVMSKADGFRLGLQFTELSSTASDALAQCMGA